MHAGIQRQLLDKDGENKAVRTFLALYGGGCKSVGAMRDNFRMAGFNGLWPWWVGQQTPGSHLTKAGAQDWLRYLFALEKAND
jgi:esterase/lipase